MNALKEIDFKFIEIENIVVLLKQAPNNERFISKLYSLMKPIFTPYLKNEEDYNDFFMKVLTNIPNLDPNKSMKNFFITISKNMEINAFVKKNRKKHTAIVYDTDKTNILASNAVYIEEERIEREIKEADNDTKLNFILETLPSDDVEFFNNYYKIKRKKTASERLRMHKLKKLIINKWETLS